MSEGLITVGETQAPTTTETSQGATELSEVQANTDSPDATVTITPEPSEALYVGKYKSIEDFESGYKELSKRVREKELTKQVAPEKYEFNFSSVEGLESYDPQNLDNHPAFAAVIAAAKEGSLSQEQMDKIVISYIKADILATPSPEAEAAKLGTDYEPMKKEIETFVGKQHPKQQEAIVRWIQTAEDMKDLKEIIRSMGEKSIPDQASTVSSVQTVSDLLQQASDLKRVNNNSFMLNPVDERRYNEIMDRVARIQLGGK